MFVGDNSGTVTALDARTGAIRWQARSFSRFGGREYFYATPTVAYGRVFASNTDGTLYAFGAGTGHLLWASHLGSYVYTAPAVWNRTVYAGTYDGRFYALDAATGATRWVREMPAAVHGAPTVMDGLVYVATCGRCGQHGVRSAKRGPVRDLRARTRAPGSSCGRSRTATTRRSSPTRSASTSSARHASTGWSSARAAERAAAATAIPVSGQIRYDVWNTRAMKSSVKIETANPAAASQSLRERRTSQTSHAVTGSQTSEGEERERVARRSGRR